METRRPQQILLLVGKLMKTGGHDATCQSPIGEQHRLPPDRVVAHAVGELSQAAERQTGPRCQRYAQFGPGPGRLRAGAGRPPEPAPLNPPGR